MRKKIKNFWKNFIYAFRRPEMMVLPGCLAFFFVLSIVPTITLISYGASFLNLPMDFISNFLEKAFNSDIAAMVMSGVRGSTLGLRFYVTVIGGFFLASNGAASIITTSNAIYGIKNNGIVKRTLKAFIMTIFLILLLLFILVVPLFGDKIIELIKYVNLNPEVTSKLVLAFNVIKGPISWFIIFFTIKIIYTMAPDKKIASTNVNYGAVFTTVLWIISTSIYSYYINNLAQYDIFYGSLANIVMIMLWFYLLSYIFTIGMALNYRKEEIKLEKTTKIDVQK